MEEKTLCVFGDSTSWGAWDMEKGGWVNRLWFEVANRDDGRYVDVYNCSISGGTTETILDRFENEAIVRNAVALIFQTGTNDASFRIPGENLVSIDKFESNIVEIITRAKKITEKIVFLDLKNCDEAKTTPVYWDDLHYTNQNILEYSRVMERVCKENGVLFLDIAPLENSDFEDGLHPNANGHEKIYKQVKMFLVEQKWI